MTSIELPDTLLREVDELVAQGAFANRAVAIHELLRLGLDAFRGRGHRRPPGPPMPPTPPGRRHPDSEQPITPDPTEPQYL